MNPPITITDGVLRWEGGAAVCADGSPHAYAVPPARGLDLLANAYPALITALATLGTLS